MSSAPKRLRKSGPPAFTLIEVLVAVAVLALLILITAQIFNSASAIVAESDKSIGSLDAGQAVLAQMSLDVSRMVLRDDVDFNFTKQPGNDSFSFYSRTTGFSVSGSSAATSPRPLSVVSYAVGPDPNNSSATAPQQLNYGALQITWTSTATSGSSPFTLSQLQTVNGTQAQAQNLTGGTLPLPTTYTTLAPEVIRLEYCFLLKADPNRNSPPKLLTAEVPTSVPGIAPIENVAGILVGIVVVDPRSRLLFPAGADAKLAAKFGDAVDNQDLLSIWTSILTPATLTALNIPSQAIQGIHIYQKYLLLPW